MKKFPVNGKERKRIGCIHEFHVNLDHKDWVADQDMNSTDPEVVKVVQGWLYGIVHTWSNTSENYVITHNHKPDHTEDEEWVPSTHLSSMIAWKVLLSPMVEHQRKR